MLCLCFEVLDLFFEFIFSRRVKHLLFYIILWVYCEIVIVIVGATYEFIFFDFFCPLFELTDVSVLFFLTESITHNSKNQRVTLMKA